jgi:MAGUK p55 subfamily protein 5
VVVDTQDPEPIKHQTPEEQEVEDAYNMMMTLDNGPHREMAVDVPESFIARSKTPPRYPPPRPQCRLQVHICPNLVL